MYPAICFALFLKRPHWIHPGCVAFFFAGGRGVLGDFFLLGCVEKGDISDTVGYPSVLNHQANILSCEG